MAVQNCESARNQVRAATEAVARKSKDSSASKALTEARARLLNICQTCMTNKTGGCPLIPA